MAQGEEVSAPVREDAEGPKPDDLNDTVLGVFVDDQVESPVADDTIKLDGTRSPGNRSQTSSNGNKGMRKSTSEPSVLGSSRSSLSSTTRRQRYGSMTKRSPLAVPPPFDLPVVDQFGFPCALTSSLDESDWDERHQLNGSENELKPKELRDYFSKPQTKKDLKREFKYNPKLSHIADSFLRNMSLPEVRERKPSPVCPDAGPPLVPTRHVFGGEMHDRDGMQRLWNDRWQKGISSLNDRCHPDHRAYFTQKSLFEESPSQNWRRYLDQEVAHGVWKSIDCKKPSKFPPLGGRLRGRSGTPIPGASP